MGSKSGLALRRISGHCTVTADKIHAWYLLDPQGWSFRPDAVREQLIVDGADVYAQLRQAQHPPPRHHPSVPGQQLGGRPRRERAGAPAGVA